MSRWSEIHFRGSHFHAPKFILEGWLSLLLRELDKSTSRADWLQEMHHSWEGYLAGVDLDYFPLDDDITDHERLTLMLSLCEAALQRVETSGELISKEEVNFMRWPSIGLFTEDLPAAWFKTFGVCFIRLLLGELPPELNGSPILDEVWEQP